MTAHSDIQITEIQQIERALDELLKAAISTQAPWQPRHDGPISARDLLSEFLDQTPVQRDAADLLDNPVGEAVRRGVTALGERLFEIGGLGLMSDVCQRVADQDPAKWGWRTDIMDKRWDGIGRTDDNPGWCC